MCGGASARKGVRSTWPPPSRSGRSRTVMRPRAGVIMTVPSLEAIALIAVSSSVQVETLVTLVVTCARAPRLTPLLAVGEAAALVGAGACLVAPVAPPGSLGREGVAG